MLKKVFLALLLLVCAGGAVFIFGPSEAIDETIRFKADAIGADPDAYLARREGQLDDIIPGAQKQIIWRNAEAKDKRPYALVYIHGFSATLQEIRPVPDMVAEQINANIFYTRLTGHGRTGDAMAQATVNSWFNDVAEAIEIGRRIGDQVIIMATSTGGTLATWAALNKEKMNGVGGIILVSPNYEVQASGADLLSGPWGRHIAELLLGKQRDWTADAKNDEQRKWWATRYPSVALVPMQASVSHVATLPVEDALVPALFIYHPEDAVVKSDVTRTVADRWGKSASITATTHELNSSQDRMHHVIAGDILSPQNNETVSQKAIEWINGL